MEGRGVKIFDTIFFVVGGGGGGGNRVFSTEAHYSRLPTPKRLIFPTK